MAASTTIRSPCRVRPPRLATTASRCRRQARSPASDATAGSAAAISALPSASALTGSPPASARCRSMSSWAASLSLRPPGANSFTPLSCHGLCDAETTAPATCSSTHQRATAGVGTTPRSTTAPPARRTPRCKASTRSGPEALVSRPAANPSPPRTSAAARPSASTASRVSSNRVSPRTPSVPKASVMAIASRRGPRRGRRVRRRCRGSESSARCRRSAADQHHCGAGRAHGTSDRRSALSACCTAVPCVPS